MWVATGSPYGALRASARQRVLTYGDVGASGWAAGQAIAGGDKVLLWYVSGNRDESAFADAGRFDVRRAPNPHQAFGGGGRHFCLGAGLARLEMQLWLEETLRRFPGMRLDGEPGRLSSTFLNQYNRIPVDVG